MKSKSFAIFALVLAIGLMGCSTVQNRPAGLPIHYHNAHYQFSFYLPAAWRGYSVLTEQWNGQMYSSAADTIVTVEHGPMIVLRNPKWKAGDPYQDVPVYVFTRRQWDDMNLGKYEAAGAGGIIYELWHNDKYVFGIHSRTFGFATQLIDWRETENIVEQNCALHAAPNLNPE